MEKRIAMVKPDAILSAHLRGNAVTMVCAQGTLCVTPYAEGIVHVSYYPQAPTPLPMWGIEGKADTSVPVCLEETAQQLCVQMPKLTVRICKSDASLCFFNASGQALTSLTTYGLTPVTVSGEAAWSLSAVFSAEAGEHYYGLGQHQDGSLDLGGKEQILWHDYSHKGGEIVAVPFLVTNRGYAVLFENTSRMKVTPGVAGKTVWEAEVGDALSFFVLCGDTTDALYEGYRKLCGSTPLPPRTGLGFIQSKQRYATQEELLEVARTYHEKRYPCDIFVVDWFHWRVLGDLCVNKDFWPNIKAMNDALAAMGYESMISCWPRFKKESLHYDFLEQKGWFMKDAQGSTVYGTPEDQRGALLDTTNPECGAWYSRQLAESYGQQGFSSWWTDENEPDISPHKSFLHAGTGARVHNLYPLTHSQCIYEGHRARFAHRCLILSRASYLGAQKYGTTFWSSDIYPEWDVLKRQIPTALNVCASGMAYWSSDIGGWQPLPDTDSREEYGSLLLATSSDGKQVSLSHYGELYTRWFQFGAFCPTFRTHGTRAHNEVWSYGAEVETILVKYLKLRYRLMPYLYSLAFAVHKTGAPFMRALWMDFQEKACAVITDEFMFGPSLLVAPVVEQGAREREVYFPKNANWVNFWTLEQYKGGIRARVAAPLDTLPLFVRCGSILPLGEEVQNLQQEQTEITLQIYKGADCSFTLYSDDGRTYAYETGSYHTLELVWNDRAQRLTANGKPLPHTWHGKTISAVAVEDCLV